MTATKTDLVHIARIALARRMALDRLAGAAYHQQLSEEAIAQAVAVAVEAYKVDVTAEELLA